MAGTTGTPSLRGLGFLGVLGPGLAMAAAGVGAGDVTMPAFGAAQFGLALIWAPILAGVLKFALNEGLARWQLATGETLVEGWALRLGPVVSYGFLVYLIVWSIPVFAALASTSGVTVHLLLPLASISDWFSQPTFADGPARGNVTWSIVLVASAATLVWFGRYQVFEKVMSAMTVFMVVVVVGGACTLFPAAALSAPWSSGGWLPPKSLTLTFAILGGTGSTVGVLAYGYWMRERRREGMEWLAVTRVDLGSCYLISAVFGVAVMLLVGGVSREEYAAILEIPPAQLQDAPRLEHVFRVVAHRLEHEAGLGRAAWLFLLALAATTTSSLLGMLQSVPYFYADLIALLRGASPEVRRRMTSGSSAWYRSLLVVLAALPAPLVAWKQPREILILYAVWGSLFMPFLAATLLVMNNRRAWVGRTTNRWPSNAALAACLAVFAWGAANTVHEYLLTDQTDKGRPLLGSVETHSWT